MRQQNVGEKYLKLIDALSVAEWECWRIGSDLQAEFCSPCVVEMQGAFNVRGRLSFW